MTGRAAQRCAGGPHATSATCSSWRCETASTCPTRSAAPCGIRENPPSAHHQRHALLGGAGDDVRLAVAVEREQRPQPAAGELEHHLARLPARRLELLENQLRERVRIVVVPRAGQLPGPHGVEGHDEPRAVLAA